MNPGSGCFARSDPVITTDPVPRSATLPALRLTQERHGWLSPDALRECADALDETPAFCHAVASFYDMFHLRPVGRNLIEVCTNVSCALVNHRYREPVKADDVPAIMEELRGG